MLEPYPEAHEVAHRAYCVIDWDDQEQPLPPLEHLQEIAALLRELEYWRCRHDELQYTLRALASGALKG